MLCDEVDFSTRLDVQISEIAILFHLHRHRQQSCKTHLWGLLKAHLELRTFLTKHLLPSSLPRGPQMLPSSSVPIPATARVKGTGGADTKRGAAGATSQHKASSNPSPW